MGRRHYTGGGAPALSSRRMSSRDHFEVIIVGAGIAGASLAAFLARRGRRDLLLLEREEQPAVHATGRSAAALVELNRQPLVRRLITEGGAFLRDPPAWLAAEAPLLDPVGVLVPAAGAAWDELRATAAVLATEGIVVELLDSAAARARVPVLAPAAVDGALLLAADGHLDVHALLQAYLRVLTRAGGELRCGVEVRGLLRDGDRCVGVDTAAGPLYAPWVVNAAGAWAGALGALADAPLAMTPRRRTIVTFAAPAGLAVARWPMVDSETHRVYFKPESGGLLASPMDETPAPPGDARPTDEDVALAVAKLAALAPALAPTALRRRWAGLRTFAADELPVVGPDPRRPGFFWLAGQGGVGIETSPVLGALAADLLVTGTSAHPAAAALAPTRLLG
jgi:D-arginine dehydrogenase